MQCDYLLGFQANRKINKSILLQKWPKNTFDVEDDVCKTPVLVYNKELDVLVSASFITRSNVEEESSSPYLENVVTHLKKEMMNMENSTLTATP